MDERDGGLKNGLGSSLAGVKWRYLDEDKAGISASFYPQILFNNPGSSSARRGLVDKGTQILFPFEFAKNIGKLGAVLELGYVFSDVLEDELLYGFAINYHLLETLELLSELHATHTTSLLDVELLFNAGTRWKFSKVCSLLCG